MKPFFGLCSFLNNNIVNKEREVLKEKVTEIEQPETNLKNLINSQEISIWSLDKDLHYVVFNDHFADIHRTAFGFDLKKGMNALDNPIFGLQTFWKSKYNAVLRGKKLIFESSEIINNKPRYFKVQLYPMTVDSKITGISAISQDITKDKQIEDALNKSNEIYRGLFQSMQCGAAIYEVRNNGEDFIFANINPAGEKIDKVSRNQLMGKNVLEAFPGIKKFGLFEVFQRVWKTGKPEYFPISFYKDNRISGWRENHVFKLSTGEIVAVYDDSTQRKQAEEALRKSKDHLRSLMNEMEQNKEKFKKLSLLKNAILESPQGIIVFALNKYYSYLDFTMSHKKIMKEIWGVDIKVGDNMLDYIKDDTDREKAKINFDRTLNGESIVLHEKYGNEKLKRTFYENRYSPVYDEKNNITGLAVYVIDITYQKEIELKLKQQVAEYTTLNENYKRLNKELTENYRQLEQINIELNIAKEDTEKSNRLKSAFLRNMSHEIRTPMNAILGFCDLLNEPHFTPQGQQEYINLIRKSSKRMLDTVHSLIEISMIESGLSQLSFSEINVTELLSSVFALFKREAEKKGLRMVLHNYPSNQEKMLTTDKEKLLKILTYLIKNAVKYTNSGSIELGYSKQSDGFRFYVKDTGIGISKEKQETIFDYFVQADLMNTKVYEGNGPGLYISKAFVEMLRGKIWVESKEGAGSQFYFTVPFVSKKVESDKRKKIHYGLATKKLKILIVDKEYSPASFVNIILQEVAEEIRHAKTGAKAIKICRNYPDIDLILIDLNLPDASGLDTVKKIRAFNKEVVIIVQSFQPLPNDGKMAREAGCNGTISNPFPQEDLLQLIEKLIKPDTGSPK